MVDLNYLDFELRIEQQESGYRARVSRSPIDEQASITFTLPFEADAVTKTGAATGTKRHLLPAPLAGEEVLSPKELGRLLFETIFRDDVLVCLRSSLTVAAAQNQGRLRIRLNLSDTPDLIDLPWEYLFDPKANRFLCLSLDTPLVRYLDVPGQIQPLTVKPPLRVLVVMASPTDYPPLNVELEWIQIQNALKDLEKRKLVTVERLATPTLTTLHDQLRQEEYQILHFIGHSSFDDASSKGIVVLEDENRHSHFVTAEHLGTILHDAKSLRLVILNACSSARTSSGEPFAGIGQLLLQQGVPAVIAMQFDISDQAAVTLARTYYKALAAGYPVDAALAEARKAIAIQDEEMEWGTPVLYMRAADGVIFTITPRSKLIPRFVVAVLVILAVLLGIVIHQMPYCQEQLIDAILQRKRPDVYSYIERAHFYRGNPDDLSCAVYDLNTALTIAEKETEKAEVYFALATVALAKDEFEQARELARRGLRFSSTQETQAFLHLADGLALCRLQRSQDAADQIKAFLDMAKSPDITSSPEMQAISLRQIQDIYSDLAKGHNADFQCWTQSLALP